MTWYQKIFDKVASLAADPRFIFPWPLMAIAVAGLVVVHVFAISFWWPIYPWWTFWAFIFPITFPRILVGTVVVIHSVAKRHAEKAN